MSIRRILVIQVRHSAADRLRERNSFLRAVGRFDRCLEFVDAYTQAPDLEREDGVQGVILAGSSLSVFEPGIPNLEALRKVVRLCVEHGWPLLGVCFGAQFIAHVMGGQVIRDKVNEELGTFDVKLRSEADADLLLRDLPMMTMVQQAHQDRILCLPDGTIHLAESELCPVQAFRVAGAPVWGIQFHPERTKADMEERFLRNLLDRTESEHVIGKARASLRDTPDADRVIPTFVERIVFGLV